MKSEDAGYETRLSMVEKDNKELKKQVKDLSQIVSRLAHETNLQHILGEITHPGMRGPTPSECSGIMKGYLPFTPNQPHNTGLMYFIGTNQGQHEWVNPCTGNLVDIAASSVKYGHEGQVADATFGDQIFFTENQPGSWVSIDFGHYRIKPTHYTMAHRAGRIGYFMRNWEIAGSVDYKEWKVLKNHVKDTTLNDSNYVGVWEITDPDVQEYRYFRITMKDAGNDKNTHALVIACFDVYGEWTFPHRN